MQLSLALTMSRMSLSEVRSLDLALIMLATIRKNSLLVTARVKQVSLMPSSVTGLAVTTLNITWHMKSISLRLPPMLTLRTLAHSSRRLSMHRCHLLATSELEEK